MTRPTFYPYRSEQAKTEYEAHCRDAARTWPASTETMVLETPSGRTFVRACGRPTDPALVLLPGARVSSLMWSETIGALSAHHRTYALDIAGDAGLSVHRGTLSKPQEYVDWLDEVLAVLVPRERVSLMGISLGGSIAVEYAVQFPGRLRKIVLICPGATVLPFAFGFYIRLTLLSLPVLALGRSPLRRTCRWLFADAVRGDAASRARVEQAMDELQRVVRVFGLRPLPWPRRFDDETLRGLAVPCLFLVGENEKIYSAAAAVRRLSRVAPQVRTEIVRGAGHDIMMVHPELVTRKALEFLDEPPAS